MKANLVQDRARHFRQHGRVTAKRRTGMTDDPTLDMAPEELADDLLELVAGGGVLLSDGVMIGDG